MKSCTARGCPRKQDRYSNYCNACYKRRRYYLHVHRKDEFSEARALDPIWGALHDLAVNAQATTPELWTQMCREFEGHTEDRKKSRARERNRPRVRLLA